MGIMSIIGQRKTRTYDGNIGQYASYLDQKIEGVSATRGKLTILGDREMDCVSIDQIAGFPAGYAIDIVPNIVPNKPNERYYLEFILYVPGKEEDKFEPNGMGAGRVKVNFGNDIRLAIYTLLMSEEVIEDLTLKPLKFEDKRRINIEAMMNILSTRREKLKTRYEENQNRLWLYYTTNLNEKPAFVVHIPYEPYEKAAVSLLERWIGNILKVGKELSNK